MYKTCDVCQKLSKSGWPTKAPMVAPPVINKPFQRISMDIIGPLRTTTKTSIRFILTIVEHATMWPEAYAIKEHTAHVVGQCFTDFVSRYGIAREVLTDLGTAFNSKQMEQLMKYYGVKHIKTTVAHPQTNAVVESFHRGLKQMLSTYIETSGDDWDEALPHALFAVREIPVGDIGFSSYELLFGRPIRGPLSILFHDWWDEAETNGSHVSVVYYMDQLLQRIQDSLSLAYKYMLDNQDKSKRYYDKKAKLIEYKLGDKVLVLKTIPGASV